MQSSALISGLKEAFLSWNPNEDVKKLCFLKCFWIRPSALEADLAYLQEMQEFTV